LDFGQALLSRISASLCKRQPPNPATAPGQFPYYVGVCSVLEEMGVLKRPHQLAGASAGSLIAAAYNTGLDM
jgi:hypothetical protein